ncbi:PDZ domain-containing protein [Opitutus sp. ER46]|uniref:PDZ domain-containing protein n=1 Tax=Opitutus sp. ER46 TaxID=2161864 RepID=UPI000D327EEB|nr:PDZ domain-containing protein [Opitutus sp. ER46]PTX94285.1 hypothetical protein DB354_11010 [Opitutus sp. ER46]
MKPNLRFLLPVFSSLALTSLAGAASSPAAAEPVPAPDPQERRTFTATMQASGPDGHTVRTIIGPVKGTTRTYQVDRVIGHAIEKEKAAFLGVEVILASETLAAQLGLARGTGLVVRDVVTDSPARAVLQEHDILLKLDDQILVDAHQLGVLIRQHKEGDEVTVTYLRAGKPATAKLKLVIRDLPKLTRADEDMLYRLDGKGISAQALRTGTPGLRVSALTFPAMPGEAGRIQIEKRGAGFRMNRFDTGNSSLVYSDETGAIELTAKDGVKTVVAKDAKGQQTFSGPATTDEERKALPAEVRAKLEKLESMQEITFEPADGIEHLEGAVGQPGGKSVRVERQPHHPGVY